MVEWELLLRLLIAAVLGSIVGADRERLVWAAGLRTHMLVCVGACLFMIVSTFGFSDVLGKQNVILDPSRVAAQVVSGIGFLGAGSILLRGEVVRGLTTAASLWTVAAIGLAVGGGLYLEAVAATVIILIILAGIKPVEERFQRRSQKHEIVVTVGHGNLNVEELNKALGYRARRVTRYVCFQTEDPSQDRLTVTFERVSSADMDEIVRELRSIPSVAEVVMTKI